MWQTSEQNNGSQKATGWVPLKHQKAHYSVYARSRIGSLFGRDGTGLEVKTGYHHKKIMPSQKSKKEEKLTGKNRKYTTRYSPPTFRPAEEGLSEMGEANRNDAAG